MYSDLWLQYIKVRQLFKGGNYSRAETIRGNTVCIIFSKNYFLNGNHIRPPLCVKNGFCFKLIYGKSVNENNENNENVD